MTFRLGTSGVSIIKRNDIDISIVAYVFFSHILRFLQNWMKHISKLSNRNVMAINLLFFSVLVKLFQHVKMWPRLMYMQSQNNFNAHLTVSFNRYECKLQYSINLFIHELICRSILVYRRTHVKWYWPKRCRLSFRGRYHFSVSLVNITWYGSL